MAMKTCPDCGKQVSTQAESCPNCGCLLQKVRNRNAFNLHDPVHLIAFVLIVIPVALFLIGALVGLIIAIVR